MSNLIHGLFSLTGLLAFGLGVISVYAWNRAKMLFKKDAPHPRFKTMWVGWIVVTLAIMFVGVKAQDAWDCNKQFGDALRARSALADSNNKLDGIDRDASFQFLTALLNPPPEIKALPQGDPKGQAYYSAVSTKYIVTITDTRNQRASNDRERAAHPLPEPTCGR